MATPNTASTSTSKGSLLDCQSPFAIKLVLLGGSDAVGKSNLVARFVYDQSPAFQESTVETSLLRKTINVDNRTVKFNLWDTAGQERYRRFLPVYYRDAQVAIVVYDITSMRTFDTAKSWVKELQSQASPNIVIALSGNKADLDDKREVQFKEAQVFAQENNLLLMETSALTAQNVTEIFVAVANRARYEEDPESKGGREPKRYRVALTPKRATKRAPY
eukprot:Em0002g1601a